MIAHPFWELRASVSSTIQVNSLHLINAERLTEEVRLLRAELDSLRRENYAARTVARDVERLRDSLALPENEGRILVSVLFERRGGELDTFILDAGLTNGVRDRMLITSPEGISIGFVERAYQSDATARLFSSAGVVTNVVLYGTTTTHAVLEGQGAGSMTVRVPKDLPLDVGTPIGLPNREGAFIGEIISIASSPENAFNTGYIRGVLNQYELRHVLVDTTTMWEPSAPSKVGKDSVEQGDEESESNAQ